MQYIQAVLHSDILVRALLLAGNIGWYPRGAARLLSSKASLLRQQALYLPGQASLSIQGVSAAVQEAQRVVGLHGGAVTR